MLNTATGCFFSMATCSAMFIAKLVLPMPGRAATMTRSPGCRPLVLRSISVNPVASPASALGFSRSSSIFFSTTSSILPIGV